MRETDASIPESVRDEAEMVLLRRDQRDRRAWAAWYISRATIIGPNDHVHNGHDSFYVTDDSMLKTNLRGYPGYHKPLMIEEDRLVDGVEVIVLPLCDRATGNLHLAEGSCAKLLVRSLHRKPSTDASFFAADLVDITNPAVMNNFWLNARDKLRERYKWPKGHFTMIDAMDMSVRGLTPYVCVFRSNHRLASVVHSKSILIIK